MSRRITRPAVLLTMVAVVVGAFIWVRPALGTKPNTSDDAKAVESTIRQSIVVDDNTGYTLDPSELSTVYVNDPRGGVLNEDTVAYIRSVRKDPTLQASQLGFLDYKKAIIEWRKQHYESYVADLRAKQTAGTLTPDEQAILDVIDGKTVALPTSTPYIAPPATATKGLQAATQSVPSSYPGPKPTSMIDTGGYPGYTPAPRGTSMLPHSGPTAPAPTPLPIIPYRLANPTLLPASDFDVTILSIEINGDVATAVTSQSDVTSQFVLVRVGGKWYIAGGHGLNTGS